MKLLYVTLVLCVSVLYANCFIRHQRVEPLYPKPEDLSGWEGRKENGGGISRSFVLKKGEAIDNSKLQIKMIDIIPGDPFSEDGSFQHQARAKIQFIRLSDNKVLCEDTYAEQGGSLITPEGCGSTTSAISILESFKISAIVIIAINLKEGWVYFQING
jgi:hypothetical protein